MKSNQYCPELKQEAVRMCIIQGLGLSELGHRLSIPKGTIAIWVARAKRGEEAFIGKPGSQTLTELSEENAKLRKEVEEAQMERDILKKQSRSLQRSHSEVRVHKSPSEGVSGPDNVSGTPGISEWILQVADPRRVQALSG